MKHKLCARYHPKGFTPVNDSSIPCNNVSPILPVRKLRHREPEVTSPLRDQLGFEPTQPGPQASTSNHARSYLELNACCDGQGGLACCN